MATTIIPYSQANTRFRKVKENERSLIDNESTIIDLKRETQALSTRVTTLEQSVARKSEQIVHLDTENNSLKSTITEVSITMV